MNLTCPSCETTFLLDPEQLGQTGRTVRCGDCGHSWHQARPAETPPEPAGPAAESPPAVAAAADASVAEPAVAETAPAKLAPAETTPVETTPAADASVSVEATPAPAEDRERIPRRAFSRTPPRPRRERRPVLVAGWIAFLVVVAGLAAGAYFGRHQIVNMAPATARLYALAGIPLVRAGAGLELRDVKSVRRLVNGERVVVIEGLVANVAEQTRQVPLLRASLIDANGVELDQWTFSAADGTLPPGGTTGFETTARNPPREGNLSISFVARN